MTKAVRMTPVLVRITILSSCIYVLLYINGFQIVVPKQDGTRAAFKGTFEEEIKDRALIHFRI